MKKICAQLLLCLAAVGLFGAAGAAQAASGKVAEAPKTPEASAEGVVKNAASRFRVVTATAYNSVRSQTDRSPNHGAWGDRLDKLGPGLRAIAVSPDLLKKGFKRGQHVRIKGHKDTYVVLDRTPRRWHNRIDIHMGTDVRAAKRWGKKRVEVELRDKQKTQKKKGSKKKHRTR